MLQSQDYDKDLFPNLMSAFYSGPRMGVGIKELVIRDDMKLR